MANERKKREWFDLGAESFARVRPGLYDHPTYPCPICLTTFTIEALAQKQLSAEHVPPESLGGRELLLTCRSCNNSSGTKLDAHARIKEDVQLALAGTLERPHRVRAMLGDLVVNAELHTSGGKYSLQVPTKINKPGTSDTLQSVARMGAQLTVEHERYADLGAKISWFRSGYLALVAVTGYELALDPAFEIVRKQILECDERKMITFTSEAPEHIPLTVRRILHVLAPEWHRGWAVEFGRYFVHFPALGDTSFYDRMAVHAFDPITQYSYRYMGWPSEPSFGRSETASA
jgi:HNH endonuclease